MIEELEGVVLAVRDARAAGRTYEKLFGARPVAEERSETWGADVLVLGLGDDLLRLAEPVGTGPVSDFLERWGEGLFAAVFAARDLDALARRLGERGLVADAEGGLVHLEVARTFGLRTAVSEVRRRERVGALAFLYEVTHLVEDWRKASEFWTDAFGLEGSRFSPIRSDLYGYEGMLTLFHPPRILDRIEVVTPFDTTKAMGRFFARRGEGPYMFFAEAPDTVDLARRLDAAGARYAGDPTSNPLTSLFVHPSATHGVLIGISPTNQAWTWSGRPELARP